MNSRFERILEEPPPGTALRRRDGAYLHRSLWGWIVVEHLNISEVSWEDVSDGEYEVIQWR